MKTLTIIPTFNEIDALPTTLDRLRAAVPESDVLIVDDNSPDGTGELAEEMHERDEQIHVLHRTQKNGWAAPTSLVFTGAWLVIIRRSWSSTPMGPISPSSFRHFWPHWTKLIW